jgi:plasmid stabilization system protein ParE
MKVRVSGKAKRDLFTLYTYVSRDNPTTARKIIRRIDEGVRSLDESGPVWALVSAVSSPATI